VVFLLVKGELAMKLVIVAVVVFLVGLVSNGSLNEISGDLRSQAAVKYRIDPEKSKFMVHANRTGLAWFRGHSHRIAVRDFSGEASLTPDGVNPASLQMTVQAASLEETDPVFTQQQKDIINKELKEIVLDPDQYPQITFQSTGVRGGLKNGKIEVVITGNLNLHGVTKPIEIPATVMLEGNNLRAIGEFDIDRDDFGVKATSAFHGLVRVKNNIKFVFDIISEKI
jgi:polyisoprenoid-binding protein YceI